MKLIVAASLITVLVSQARADEPVARYDTVADLKEHLAEHRGAVVKLRPSSLTATPSTFYGCAYRNSKKWESVMLTDANGDSVQVYVGGGKAVRLHLDRSKDHQARLLSATLRVPKANPKCAVPQFELVNY